MSQGATSLVCDEKQTKADRVQKDWLVAAFQLTSGISLCLFYPCSSRTSQTGQRTSVEPRCDNVAQMRRQRLYTAVNAAVRCEHRHFEARG